MSSATAKSPRQIRATTSMIASILLGLVLLASGSGKVIGFGEMPGQALEFLDVVIPDFLLTPAIAIFIGTIFLPHIIPWAENENTRLEVKNAILLCGLHDLAFENKIITLSNSYKIHISSSPKGLAKVLKSITYPELRLPASKEHYPSKKYIQEHRSK